MGGKLGWVVGVGGWVPIGELKHDSIHKGGPDWRKEQFGTACSPINANQDSD